MSLTANQATKLGLRPGGVPLVLHTSQYDQGRMVTFTLYNGSDLYVIPEGVSGTIRCLRPNGTAYAEAVTVNCGASTVVASIGEQINIVAGRATCEIVLVDSSENRLGTANFYVEVEKAPIDDDAQITQESLAYAEQVLDELQSVAAYHVRLTQAETDIDSLESGLAAEITNRTNAVSAEATARANAVAAEASARQSADNTLQSNINAEASTRASADNTLQAQIDQLVAPSGSAPSAAEVENARIGADGTTYDTLGNAIRGQVGDLKGAIDDIATVTCGTNVLRPDYEDGFITSAGAYSSPDHSFRSKRFIPVSGSNIVKMASTGTTISSVYVACYNSTRTFLERISVNTTPTTLPTGTAFIKACSSAISAATAATYEIGLALSAEATTYEAYKVIPVLNVNTVFPESLYTHIHDESETVFNDSISDYIVMQSGNILDPSDYEDGFIKSDGDYSSPEAAFRSKSYIPVSGSSIVYTRGTGAGDSSLSSIYVACYNSSKTFLERITLTTTPATLPTGTAFIRATSNAATAATAATMQMGIVLSNHPEKYTQYQLRPMLRENVVIEGVHRHGGLYWCAMGDSITEGTYSDGDGAHVNPDVTWAALTAELACYDLDNKGIGGTGWVKKGAQGNKKNAREQVDDIDFSAYDLVTLSFGINDWKGGVTWGTMADTPELGGTVYSNMKYVLQKIITDNPYAKVIVITPFNCRQGKSQLATEATNYAIGYDYDGHTLQDMYDLEVEVCEYYGIQYLDMTHTSIINRLNAVTATPDAVHPSLDAHRCIAYQTANSLMYNS